jgi:phospholipid/cholesterol/gamma-HCH transport system substrate-binding protein
VFPAPPRAKDREERVSRRTEIQVGATVLVALLILLVGVTWLKQISLTHRTTVWHVRFDQAGGIGEGITVQVNGIRKGAVQKAELHGDGVVVDLALDSDVELTDRSRIAIRDLGVMGDKVVVVDFDPVGRRYAKSDTLTGIYEPGLPEMMSRLSQMVSSVGTVTDQLATLTAGPEGGQLGATMANFRATSEELRLTVVENRVALNRMVRNFSDASHTARNLTTGREAELQKAIDDFGRTAENMNRLSTKLDSLRHTMQEVAGRVERGEGTLGRLVSDEKLYTDLQASVKSINELIVDVKAHPKRYFKFSVF